MEPLALISPPEQEPSNAAALAWVVAWYATPDDQPPGFWEALQAVLDSHPITVSSDDNP